MANASSSKAANRGPMDTYLFSGAASLYKPKPWATTGNFTFDTVSYDPSVASQGFGSDVCFTVPNNVASYLGRLIWEAEITPGAHTNGTDARFDDFLAYALLEKAAVKYGQQELETLSGEHMKLKFYNEQMSEYAREAKREWLKGPFSPAERSALFATGGKIRVEIPFSQARGVDNVMPQVMGSSVQYNLKIRALADVTQGTDTGNYTVTPTLINQKLYVEQIYVAPNEQALLQSMQSDAILQLIDNERTAFANLQNPVVAGSSGQIEVPLTPINTSCTYLTVILRAAEQLATAGAIDRWSVRGGSSDPSIRIRDVAFVANNGEVKSRLPFSLYKNFIEGNTRDGPTLNDDVLHIDFSKHPGAAAHAFGSLDLGLLTNPKLIVYFDVLAAPADTPILRCDVFGTTKNLLKYTKGQLYAQFV